jgi:hypothetical protein
MTTDRRSLSQRMADALRAPALVESPESTRRHDPAINRAFNALFGHPDNADLARAFTVGLPINDPPKPVEAAPAKVKETVGAAEVDVDVEAGDRFEAKSGDPRGFAIDGIRFKDADGDEIKVALVTPNNDADTGSRSRVVFTVNGEHAVALTLGLADDLTDFLDDLLGDDEAEGASA